MVGHLVDKSGMLQQIASHYKYILLSLDLSPFYGTAGEGTKKVLNKAITESTQSRKTSGNSYLSVTMP